MSFPLDLIQHHDEGASGGSVSYPSGHGVP